MMELVSSWGYDLPQLQDQSDTPATVCFEEKAVKYVVNTTRGETRSGDGKLAVVTVRGERSQPRRRLHAICLSSVAERLSPH